MRGQKEHNVHVPYGGGAASLAANYKSHTRMDEGSVRDMKEALCVNEKCP